MTKKWVRFKAIGGQEVNYSEKTIQNKIIKDLKAGGYWVMKTQGGVAGTPIGAPDIIACSTIGQFIAIEVKKIGGRLSDEQFSQIGKISQNTLEVYVTNDPDFGKEIEFIFGTNDETKNPTFKETATYCVFKGRYYEALYD